MMATTPYYESDEGLAQYLLLHYGEPADVISCGPNLDAFRNFPLRCVEETMERSRIPAAARALDLGCAVGRSSFALARFCAEVVGIDYSMRFIAAAERLRNGEVLSYDVAEQGELRHPLTACRPDGVLAGRVRFEQGDAQALRPDLGTFDVVLLANLLCRLAEPRRCLARMATLVRPGGQLVITTPSTWRQIHTPRGHWLGGFTRDGRAVRTLDGLTEALGADFVLARRLDLPLLIREHARKFEYIVAEATVWIRS